VLETWESNSFAEDFGVEVVFAETGNPYRNKGCNEVSALRTLERDVFDCDYIVKLTGRYCPNSMMFFDELSGMSSEHDAIYLLRDGQAWTGCFACDTDHFFRIMSGLDLDRMESEWLNLETVIIKELSLLSPVVLPKVDVTARISLDDKESLF